jgi:hypothetical protein
MIPRLLRPALLALAAVLALTACQSTSPRPNRQLGYANLPPLTFDVARIDIVQQYQPPQVPPNVDHLAPVPPVEAARRWASDRLRAMGSSGTLRVIIKDASIIETSLRPPGGLRGALTNDQAERYDGHITVEMIAEVPARRFQGYTSASVARTTTVPENISLQGREDTWHTMVERMMTELNTKLEEGVNGNLSAVSLR